VRDIGEQGHRVRQGERDGVSPRVQGDGEGGAPVRRGGAWRRRRTPVDDGGQRQVLEHPRDEVSVEEPKKKGGKSRSMELITRRQWRRGRLRNPARDSGSGIGERTHGFGKSRGGDDLLRRESACKRKGGER
jgi:hypothetical protein